MSKNLQNRLSGKEPHILTLMLLSAFAAMGAILMTPAIPSISAHFSRSIGTTQLIVTSFLLGYAFGQLLYGPIANRFGRKPALYLGIGVATLGSLFSIIASPIESFPLLVIGRVLEALGSSAGLVISFTIINEFYYQDRARRIISNLMLAFAVAPGIAVALGGILTQFLGWQSCFYFLLLYGLMLLVPAKLLPETLSEPQHDALKLKRVLRNYFVLFKNKKLVSYALCSSFSSACLYTFGAEGPFIGIHLLHISPFIYGLFGLIPYAGYLVGSFLAMRFSTWRPAVVLKIAFGLEGFATIVMLVCFVLGWVSLWSLLLPMVILCMGHPMLGGTSLSLAMRKSEDKSNGSAVASGVAILMPVVMTLLLGMLHINAAWLLPCIFLLSLVLMALVFCAFLWSDNES